MYSADVLDHFQHPRNAGDLPQANIRVRVENPVCADVLELYIQLNGDEVVGVGFRAKGCVPSVACASLLTELLRGKSLTEVDVSAETLIAHLGGLPQTSKHAAQLAIEALNQAKRDAAKSAAQHG